LAHQVEARLVENGLDWEFATIVASSLTYLRAKVMQKTGKKNMIFGTGFCSFGIVLTALIFQSPTFFNVKYYLIAEVMILVGVIEIFLGIFQFFRGLRASSNENYKNNVRSKKGKNYWTNK
jgi:cadmium resistance protein CadD (predicted permease)